MKRLQLTLRDLFWLVALVAMGLGWWRDRVHAEKDRVHAEKRAEFWKGLTKTAMKYLQSGCEIKYDEDTGDVRIRQTGT